MITLRPSLAPIVLVAVVPLLLAGCAQRSSENGTRTLEERYASLGTPSPTFDAPDRMSRVSRRATPAQRHARPLVPSLRGFVAERVTMHDVDRARKVHVVLRSDDASGLDNYLEVVTSESEDGLFLLDGKPTETSVRQRLSEEFPGTRMHVVTTQRYNAYGPYGLALGVTSAGERCAYAWQWTDLKRASPAALRGRVCTPRLSLDDLAARFDRIALDGADPASKVARSRPRVGTIAASAATPVAATPVAAMPVAALPRAVAEVRPIAPEGRRYLVAPETTPDRAVPRPPADIAGPAPAPTISLPPEALRGPERTGAGPSVSINAPARPALRS